MQLDGPAFEPRHRTGRADVRALGPDLYAGSSGIALFLAELHAMTGDEEFRRTSLGAIHRSILQLARRPSSGLDSPLSLFLGELGVAYVAWRVGALIGRDAVAIPTRALLDRVAAAVAGPHPLDVLGGGAGAIPALLSLARTPGLEPCRKLAIELGEDLCRHEGAMPRPARGSRIPRRDRARPRSR